MEDNIAIKLLNNCLEKAGIFDDRIYFYEDILDINIKNTFSSKVDFKVFNDMLNYILENLKDYHDEGLTDYLISTLNEDLYDNFKRNDTFREIILNLFWEALDSENKYEFQNVLYFYEHIDKMEKFYHTSFDSINEKGLLLEMYEEDINFHNMLDNYVYGYLDTLERINNYNETNRNSKYKVKGIINEKLYNLIYNTKKLLDDDYEEISKKMITLFLLYEREVKNDIDILLFFLNTFEMDLRNRPDIIYAFRIINAYKKVINREIFTKSYLYLKNNMNEENEMLFLKLDYFIKSNTYHLSLTEEDIDELINIYLYTSDIKSQNYEEEDIKKLVKINPLLPLNLI